jgi:hypothetical protein
MLPHANVQPSDGKKRRTSETWEVYAVISFSIDRRLATGAGLALGSVLAFYRSI